MLCLQKRFYHKGHKGHKENLKGVFTLSARPTFVLFVSFVVKIVDKINRPSHMRRAIWFDLSYLSTSKASPNDSGIVIVIIIGEADFVLHDVSII